MPSINTSDIIRASDSTYFVDIARVKKCILTYLLTYMCNLKLDSQWKAQCYLALQRHITLPVETHTFYCARWVAQLASWQAASISGHWWGACSPSFAQCYSLLLRSNCTLSAIFFGFLALWTIPTRSYDNLWQHIKLVNKTSWCEQKPVDRRLAYALKWITIIPDYFWLTVISVIFIGLHSIVLTCADGTAPTYDTLTL